MSDDQDDAQKTEEPTQKKLSDAMEKGDFAKSQEIKNWFVLFGAAIVALVALQGLARNLRETMAGVLEFSYRIPTDGSGFREFIGNLILQVGSFLTFPAVILVLAALAGAMIQHRPMLTFEKIKPKLNKISPISGFKNKFSMQNFVEFLKSCFKLILVGTIVVFIVWPEKEMLENMMTLEVTAMNDIVYTMVIRVLIGVVIVMGVIAGLDFLFQKFQFMKKMRMTKQEVKDEHKQSDGDPLVKARLRQIRMEKARSRMMAAVPEADVVVTNPTHYSVALKYEHGQMQVPKVIAKGIDDVAFRIREVAKEHDIPILENPPLARTLYAAVEVDEEIHSEHYQAVAEIIGYVMRLKKGERVVYQAPKE
ncbi:flagellar biosynthesis protein FlhB [Pseudemcibacter aquimaris]|uniref:flagellar biosynthesis protein FlhB n=1 Tax=Pseudemcibacter aquimaris TaxID=2857064 RepID=UPI002011517D|nr:flagellar biosynthesis protein FlhB [Pseudemcibacter aquimaris]MCC3860830.1 flagellar biosynthesis protein FlhB [Pseudemcibacter aquimaris]WDU59649.1 flagellar biosynthesis protein FlhB [Pseudemcibacter aquimaris]